MYKILFFILCIFSSVSADSILIDTESRHHQQQNPAPRSVEYNYPRTYISNDVWETVKPYLLPSNHPLKAKLDMIFGNERVTRSVHALKNAGFSRCQIRAYSDS